MGLDLAAPQNKLRERERERQREREREKTSLICKKGFEQQNELSPQNQIKKAKRRTANQTTQFVKRGWN